MNITVVKKNKLVLIEGFGISLASGMKDALLVRFLGGKFLVI